MFWFKWKHHQGPVLLTLSVLNQGRHNSHRKIWILSQNRVVNTLLGCAVYNHLQFIKAKLDYNLSIFQLTYQYYNKYYFFTFLHIIKENNILVYDLLDGTVLKVGSW